MHAMINLILHACDELDFDEQISLAEKIKRRALKKRREQLKKECDAAAAEVENGEYVSGITELFKAVDKELATNAKNKKR